MIITSKKILRYIIKNVHFSDHPFDIEDCDAVKFSNCKRNINAKGFHKQKEFTSIIDLTQDLETIWQRMNKNTTSSIKRAKKEGITIQKCQVYERFFPIYQSFIHKKGFKSIFDVFGVGTTTLKEMKNHGTLFVSCLDGELLSGVLFLENQLTIESWISASKRLEVEQHMKNLVGCANRLLKWESIQYAKEKGMTEYDLGGLWPQNETEKDGEKRGINSFKLGFGGNIVTRHSYSKIYSNDLKILYTLYNTKNINKWKKHTPRAPRYAAN